ACAQEMPNKQDAMVDTIINTNDEPTSVLYKLQLSLGKNIADISKTIDHKSLYAAVDLMRSAQQIYVAGEGASGLATQDLFYKVIRSVKNLNFAPRSHIVLEQEANINKEDNQIVYPYSDLAQEPLLIAKQAEKNNAKILSVTRIQD